MKKLLIIGLIGILFIGLSFAIKKEYVIYIDPGHGGYDGGATYEDINENQIVMPVAKSLKNYLTNLGINVKMTREDDVALGDKKIDDLNKRIELMEGSDLYISIHANAYTDKKYSGAQVFYSNNNEKNIVISKSIQNVLCKTTSTTRVNKEVSGIMLLDGITTPGCLIELGFLSNDEERNKLIDSNYQDLLAYSIYLGVLEYLNLNNLI